MHRIRLLVMMACAAMPAAAQQKAPPAQPAAAAQAKPAPAATPAGVKLVAKMPAPATPAPFHFPGSVTKTLPNGLNVYVISGRAVSNGSAEEPAVSIEMLIRDAGAAHDPAGKPGVASLTAALLTEGTEKRSAQEIAGAIDFVGGSLSAAAGRDGTTIRVSVVKKDFDLAMDLLSDITLHAKFAPEEIERQREQLLSGMQVDYSDGSYLASAVFKRVVFGSTAYGLPADGTPESVRALTRDDLVMFRDQFYAPNRAMLAFAGDVTPDEAFGAADKFFGAWPRGNSTPDLPIPQRPRGLRVFLVDKADAVQTQIRIGRLGIPRDNPDYVPLEVTNQIFGGGYNSRLNTVVRLKKGLTYDATADFNSYLRAGSFEASTFTRTEATVDATKLVVDEIARMTAGDVTTEELDVARDYLAGVFTLATETPADIADRVLTAAFYRLPEGYNQTFPDKVRAVTADQVRQMAGRYFDAQDMDLVLVGNASAFRDALKQAFPAAAFEEIPASQLDLLAPDLRQSKAAATSAAGSGLGPGAGNSPPSQ
jgi:zinc protease